MISQIWPESILGILLNARNVWETDCIHSRRIFAIDISIGYVPCINNVNMSQFTLMLYVRS